jgi:hypothetical protein
MIIIALIIVVVFAVACLAFGIRTRQPSAFVASLCALVTPCCAYFWLISGLSEDRLAGRLWLAGFALSVVLAGFFALTAWRRWKLAR